MSNLKFRAAAVHGAPVYMNKTATLQKAVSLIKQAGADGITLLVFPETFIPGSSEILQLTNACRDNGVAISLGISERVKNGNTLFNSQLNIDANGTILSTHRKLQPTYVERAVWAQGSGHTLRTWKTEAGYKLDGLCCWENTMNGTRQALIEEGQDIHAGAWPALSTMAGFESGADSQIEALMKAHALTGQCFVLSASNYVDDTCLEWMAENLREQDWVKRGGGWSAVIHPFCVFLAGPHTGEEEKLVTAEIDLGMLAAVKVWVDASGHYKRLEMLGFRAEKKAMWSDDRAAAEGTRRKANAGTESMAEGALETGQASRSKLVP
ncbi:hypothetical protein B0A49_01449 [Cryomyces minteri]|uniref:CN hydrolase domain-containing protein n=1 Tax=Cryomyces minteri TaxID=331657 RepID=A0A4U0XMQ9_9PEZI|nr:hypothetical protein B0A49_01449 [Cryomyces minteri]